MVSLYYVSAVDTINDGQSKSILYSKYYMLVFFRVNFRQY